MLAIVSDLHFQQTRFDALRYRDRAGRLMQLGVRRNVKPGAVRGFFGRIGKIADRLSSDEIHVVFAGDIFELHRTALWFMGEHARRRPTQRVGAEGGGLCKTIEQVLDGIAEEHHDVFEAIKAGTKELRRGRRVSVHYVPGNHDRLANAWATVRRKIRTLLGIRASGKEFPVLLDFTADGDLPDYGVRVRHGHQYDGANMGRPVAEGAALDLDWEAHLKPCLGDFMTVDFATRLAVTFRALHARKLRDPGDEGEEMRKLYLDLTEFDDVRPQSRLEEYLAQRTGGSRKAVFQRLQKSLSHLVAHAAQDHWFKREIGRRAFIGALLLDPLRRIVRSSSAVGLSRIVQTGLDLKEKLGGDPAEIARFELERDDGIAVVVAGHTHHPDQVPIGNGRKFFLDSGTWRTDIRAGKGAFGRLRAYTTMVFCFDQSERVAGDGRRFETWTGHLAEGSAGPYDDPATHVTDDVQGERVLRFTKLTVHDVEHEWDGAEIVLRFGVDGHGGKERWDGVKKGDVKPFPKNEFPLDPGLDGEVWCHGREKDGVLDPDDLLPLGVAFLERMKYPSRQYRIERNGLLVLHGLNDTDMTVHYEVVKAARP